MTQCIVVFEADVKVDGHWIVGREGRPLFYC